MELYVKIVKDFSSPNDLKLISKMSEIIRHAFEERTKQGLLFKCRDINAHELEKLLLSDIDSVLCYDNDTLIGLITFCVKVDTCWVDIVAVEPKYKRNGVGKVMFLELLDYCTKLGLDKIYSDTSVFATSSIKWHELMGFRKFRMSSYKSTNYYSWNFIRDAKDSTCKKLLRKVKLPFSVIKCRVLFKRDGGYTFCGDILKKIKIIK
ncbi:MAG: GNAT family N-acetyltransferase [Prevotella koreensis]|uniref:GNAT family N-acetyltransferase n=1 Tax=Prevotella koreensis TaxID=2490854 RepID=UPI003FA09892